jgi:hypothetical protein
MAADGLLWLLIGLMHNDAPGGGINVRALAVQGTNLFQLLGLKY